VIGATYVVLSATALAFACRLVIGPSLSDRLIGVDGLLLVGVAAVATRTVDTGAGTFLPVLVVLALVGFIGTAVVARFVIAKGR
jgi:multicomponent Na+:H+ antiporter subunit F